METSGWCARFSDWRTRAPQPAYGFGETTCCIGAIGIKIDRYVGNPVVTPGIYPWREVVVLNPAVVLHDDEFYMFERACSSLAPLKCQVGLLKSADGFHFEHVVDHPVFTPEQRGTPRGTVEDPRVVKIGDTFYMTHVHRNYASSCYPTGKGIPVYRDAEGVPASDPNNYRSGIALSKDMIHWEDLGLVTPPEIDDRDAILFPEKIGGKFAMLRRPVHYVGPEYACEHPSIWVSYSSDLLDWSKPRPVASAGNPSWEGTKIGAGAPPIATDEGWIALFHGVDEKVQYRVGIMLLDLDDPSRVIARCPDFVMEPEAYYERFGLIIPRVIFPTANVVKGGTVYIYTMDVPTPASGSPRSRLMRRSVSCSATDGSPGPLPATDWPWGKSRSM